MIAEIVVGGVGLKYAYPDGTQYASTEPLYPFLEEVGAITESTTAESGSCTITLGLGAYVNLGLPLGAIARIKEGTEILFEGVVADVTIETSITLQVEA